MSQAVTALAERLAKAIAESPEATALRAAKDAIRADSELAESLKSFNDLAEKVRTLTRENKPVEAWDKQELQRLHDVLVASELFKQYTAAQVNYADLMRRVSQTLGKELQETEKPV